MSPNHAISHQKFPGACTWDIFSFWALPNNFSSLSHPPPQTKGTPHTSNGLSVADFCFKKTYQWSQVGKIDPKDYQNKGVS